MNNKRLEDINTLSDTIRDLKDAIERHSKGELISVEIRVRNRIGGDVFTDLCNKFEEESLSKIDTDGFDALMKEKLKILEEKFEYV